MVHRLAVEAPRDKERFDRLNVEVNHGTRPVPLFVQRQWMREQGPRLSGLVPWLEQEAASFDVVVFFTYLYAPTFYGLPVAARHTATLLHPAAHDEPPLWLPIFEPVFRHPRAFGFFTPEEHDLVARRFAVARPYSVTGLGVTVPREIPDPAFFRERTGLGQRPYLLCVGRVDPHKGTDELHRWFAAYKQRRPSSLALVFLGDAVTTLPAHPDIFLTGFVDDGTKAAALGGCTALVQPSYYESFSLALAEAWAYGRPALVQGHCEVLEGQAYRSRGAIPYHGFAEFETAVDLVIDDPALARSLGSSGRRYVELELDWDRIMERYEHLLFRTSTAVF